MVPPAATPVTPAVVDDRHRLGLEANLGPGVDGHVDEVHVEAVPRPHRAVSGEPIGDGPRELADFSTGDHPQPVDAMCLCQIDLQVVECGNGARRETIAAHLVASVGSLVEEHHPQARSRRRDGSRRTRRTTADDEQVALVHRSSLPAIGPEPSAQRGVV